MGEARSDEEKIQNFIEELKGAYAFVAISEDYEFGFYDYTNADICINIGYPQNVPVCAAFFTGQKGMLDGKGIEITDYESLLTGIFDSQLKDYGFIVGSEYVCGNTEYGIVLAPAGVYESENSKSVYKIGIFHGCDFYSGNIYFNCTGKTKDFSNAAKEWLKTFKL